MTSQKIAPPVSTGQLVERVVDQVGMLGLLALGVVTAGATLMAGF